MDNLSVKNFQGNHLDAYKYIRLDDISNLMQQCVAKKYTFMFSDSGLPNNYNIYIAYMNENWENKSVHLSYHKDEGLIRQCADENHAHEKFNSIDKVMDFLYNELGD